MAPFAIYNRPYIKTISGKYYAYGKRVEAPYVEDALNALLEYANCRV
jgi:hypothetical protein